MADVVVELKGRKSHELTCAMQGVVQRRVQV
jgi:hypothetical protein